MSLAPLLPGMVQSPDLMVNVPQPGSPHLIVVSLIGNKRQKLGLQGRQDKPRVLGGSLRRPRRSAERDRTNVRL